MNQKASMMMSKTLLCEICSNQNVVSGSDLEQKQQMIHQSSNDTNDRVQDYSNVDNEREETNDEETSENESSECSLQSCFISDILKQSELIQSLLIPLDIIYLIEEFSCGEIIKCVYCEKEDHMNTQQINEKQNNENWIFCDSFGSNFDLYDTICSECHDKYLCTLCLDNLDKDNYKCKGCKMIICNGCDESGYHLSKHAEENLELPQLNYMKYIELLLKH